MLRLSRRGFQSGFLLHPEEFYLAEALEYVTAWKQSSETIHRYLRPIGPTEQLPLVARLVNELNLNSARLILGMDEWFDDWAAPCRSAIRFPSTGRPPTLFDRIRPELGMPDAICTSPRPT